MLGSSIQIALAVGAGQSLTFNDDTAINLGTGDTVSLIYETADANANALLFVAPEGGATDVPAFIFGDASILNVDLGWFNGLTEPSLVVVNDAADAYVRLDAGDDAVAGSKGLYFKAAADEDIELINLSVTGTPRVFWDESEDAISFPNITLGANGLKTTNHRIDEEDATWLAIRNVGDTAYSNLKAAALGSTDYLYFYTNATAGINFQITGQRITNVATDDFYYAAHARDTGVGQVEVTRWQGAADPYIQIGRDDTGVGLSAVTDMLVLQAGGGTGNEAANFGLGTSWKIGNASSEVEERGSIDLVLQTATNASEDASWIFKSMVAGSMVTVMSFGGYAGVSKLGFYATAPVALQTGVAVTAAGIHAALVNLGLITA